MNHLPRYCVALVGLSVLVAWSTWPRNYELSAISGIFGYLRDVHPTYKVSADGKYAVYLADMSIDDRLEVYSVRMDDQGAPLRLSSTGQVVQPGSMSITPDGTRVGYRTTANRNYIVPIDGSAAPLELPGWLTSDPNFVLGGSRYVYVSGEVNITLWSAGLDGTAPMTLDAYSYPLNQLPEYRTRVEGERVLYSRLHDTGTLQGHMDLCSVPADGSAAPLVLDHHVGGYYQLSPDGERAIYAIAPNLYQVPVDGSAAPCQLNGPLVAGGTASLLEVSPDGTRVLYLADQDTDQVFELFSVPIGGGTAVKLNGPLAAGGSIFQRSIAPDSERLVFCADPDANGSIQLFSVPLTGGVPQELQGTLDASADVASFKISPDGDRVAFTADLETDEAYGLYVVPIDGSAQPIRASDPVLSPGNLFLGSQFGFAPNSATLVYAPDPDGQPGGFISEPIELFAVLLDGSADPVRLSGPLVSGGSVRFATGGLFMFDAQGLRLAYLADQQQDETVELFGSRLPHPRPVRRR